MKIIAKEARETSAYFETNERARFFAYLGGHGLSVTGPAPNKNNNLIESRSEGKDLFLAYSYRFLPGETLSPDKWTDSVLESWGALIGQTHRLTQDYPVFDGIPEPVSGKKIMYWESEINSFIDMCEDDDVKEVWLSLKEKISALTVSRKTCGMVQNDPHMENMLIHDGNLSMIDFDVSTCHFFASDLAIAMQSVLFTLAGGMERPLGDKEALKRFVTHLLNGYRRECNLPTESFEAIDMFIAYRRALLFTVMQDWLKTRPELWKEWKRLTVEQPALIETISLP